VRLIYVPLINRIAPRLRLQLLRGPEMVPEIVYLGDTNIVHFQRVSITRIIIFKLDHIGDMIVGLRAIQLLRESFPQSHITLVCASWNFGWAQQLGWFDSIVKFDFFSSLNRDWKPTSESLRSLYDSVSNLPLSSYDLAVDLRHDIDTRACLYRVKATYRAGFYAPAEPGMPYLDLVLPDSESIEVAETLRSLHAELRLQMLAASVVAVFGAKQPHPARKLVRPEHSPTWSPFAVLAIGAGDPIRCWPIDRYAEVGRALIAQHGLDIIVLGGPTEQADAARLTALLPEGRARSVINQPLSELPSLISNARLCVSNGSGMSHLSAALGVPTVCILSGTSRMEVWHPAGPNSLSIGGRTPCQPCGFKLKSQCPWGVPCLTSVGVADVLDACERVLYATSEAGAEVTSPMAR
jgi:ADP-heptose:LPS heptosyltransferase